MPVPRGAQRARLSPVASSIVLVMLFLLALLAAVERGTAAPLDADAPPELFSQGRAREAATALLADPRVTGTEAAEKARTQLVTQLDALGYRASIRPGVGVFVSRRATNNAGAGYVHSVVAERPGTDPSGTIVLAAHYDSVPGSPGGGDDGVGVAVVLEVARALATEPQPRNDVVLLLTDGEEPGLLGAEAFVHDAGARLRGPVVVINHDARGASGTPLITRSAGDMGSLAAAAPRAELETFTSTLFDLAPSDTDFSRFQDAGWLGVDVALIGGSSVYHSPADTFSNLDDGSLQSMGETTLAMARSVLDEDVASLPQRQRYVYTTAPWGPVSILASAQLPIALTTLSLAALSLVRRRRRGDLRLRDTCAAAGVLLGFGLLGLAVAASLWPVAKALSPEIASAVVGEPAVAWPFLWGEVVAAALATASAAVVGRRWGPWAVSAAALLGLAVLLSVSSALVPGLATPLLLPIFAVAFVAALSPGLTARMQLVLTSAALIPIGFVAGSQVDGSFEFGASSGGFSAFVALLCLTCCLPLICPALEHRALGAHRRPRRPLLAAWLLVPALFGGGIALNAASAQPRQALLRMEVDSAAGTGRWSSPTQSGWAQQLVEAPPTPSPLPAPTVRVISSAEEAAGRRVRLRITSNRGAAALRVTFTDADRVRAVSLQGRPVKVGETGLRTLSIAGLPATGAELAVLLSPGAPLPVTVQDVTHDLGAVPGFAEAPPGWILVQPVLAVATAPTL